MSVVSLDIIAKLQQKFAASRAGKQSSNFGSEHVDPSMLARRGKYSDPSNPNVAPWVVQPESGVPFASNGTINTPAATSVWTDVIGPAGQYPMQVPNGYDGVIKSLVCFYNGAGFISGSGALIWRILMNGVAIRNYDNILVQFGVAPFPGTTEGIRITSSSTIQFQVKNVSVAGAGTQIFCYLGGYYYSNKLT